MAIKSNKVTAAVVIEGVEKSFIGKAGDQHIFGVLTQDNFKKGIVKNFHTGKIIGVEGKHDKHPPGNCAEQKALFAAFQAERLPALTGKSVSLSVLEQIPGSRDRRYKPSCNTCKRILASMMCTNPASPEEKT